ncbi:unnamed protein product [Gadus morhua 'NCC']
MDIVVTTDGIYWVVQQEPGATLVPRPVLRSKRSSLLCAPAEWEVPSPAPSCSVISTDRVLIPSGGDRFQLASVAVTWALGFPCNLSRYAINPC